MLVPRLKSGGPVPQDSTELGRDSLQATGGALGSGEEEVAATRAQGRQRQAGILAAVDDHRVPQLQLQGPPEADAGEGGDLPVADQQDLAAGRERPPRLRQIRDAYCDDAHIGCPMRVLFGRRVRSC